MGTGKNHSVNQSGKLVWTLNFNERIDQRCNGILGGKKVNTGNKISKIIMKTKRNRTRTEKSMM